LRQSVSTLPAIFTALQKQPADFFVGEFIYGWGNNYAGGKLLELFPSVPC
jgi:hypothetical protein